MGDYTYMAGGTKLFCLVAGTELATQRNPERSGGIIISVFIGVPFISRNGGMPQSFSFALFHLLKWLLWYLGCSKLQQFPGARQAVCLCRRRCAPQRRRPQALGKTGAGRKHGKEFVCNWKRDTGEPQTFLSGVSMLKERFLSPCPI